MRPYARTAACENAERAKDATVSVNSGMRECREKAKPKMRPYAKTAACTSAEGQQKVRP